MEEKLKVNQDRQPNFRDENGKLFLVRCFACDPERGRENAKPSVASGICCHCFWNEKTPGCLKSYENKICRDFRAQYK